jgi:hypothetical protein
LLSELRLLRRPLGNRRLIFSHLSGARRDVKEEGVQMSTTIPGDTSTTATITQGQVLNGELTFSGDSDWYRAEMTAGLDYGFTVSGDGSGSSLPDADLYLYDSTGNRLTGETNYSQTSTSITFKAPASGPYYVGVTDSSDLGNYKLTWLGNDTVLRNAATTATLAQGETFKSAIDVAGDSDWVKVELKAGLNYGFNVSGDGSQSSLPDGDLNLRDADGNVVVSGTNYSNSSYSIYEAAEHTGAYYLEVVDSSDTGNYKLSWLGNDTILRNNQTTVSLGSTKTHTSAIEVNGDSDWFKVKLEAGISYAFRFDGTGVSKLPDGDVNIRDADGNIVSSGTNYRARASPMPIRRRMTASISLKSPIAAAISASIRSPMSDVIRSSTTPTRIASSSKAASRKARSTRTRTVTGIS